MRTSIILLLFFNTTFLFAQKFKEEEVTLKSKPGDLFGTLLIPEDYEDVVVLIIPGSGPTDRDGNSAIIDGKNNSLKYLAENMAVAGISSLRIDKRGVGKSASASISEKDLRFDNYIDDVIDWGYQILNDVRFKRIIIAGHSEGSLVGMVAAKELDASGYISLAGAGFSIDEIILKQLSTQSEEMHTEAVEIFSKLKKGELVDKVSNDLASIFRPSIQPYFISWIKHNPAEEIAKLSIPILIINGTTDIQIGPENAESLHRANTSSELIIIEEMNHVFKKAPMDMEENMKTYSDPSLPNVSELSESIVKFIKSLNE